MPGTFDDFDFGAFWDASDYATRKYIDDMPDEHVLNAVQAELGYVLPRSYIDLARYQNGGIPAKRCHRTASRTSWSADHIAITGIFSVGRKKPASLCGELGQQLWIEEWGYPMIGVYFADCPSAGHDMLCLDYRECGANGEPRVVHIDQEFDYRITFVARSFEAFIRGLEDRERFEAS
jgi:hypothetical protein